MYGQESNYHIVVNANKDSIPDMKIFVLVVDNMFDTGLTAILDTLDIANELISNRGGGIHFEVTITGVRSSIQTRLGLSVSATLATSLPCPDLVIVPAIADRTPDMLTAALQRPDVVEEIGRAHV